MKKISLKFFHANIHFFHNFNTREAERERERDRGTDTERRKNEDLDNSMINYSSEFTNSIS